MATKSLEPNILFFIHLFLFTFKILKTLDENALFFVNSFIFLSRKRYQMLEKINLNNAFWQTLIGFRLIQLPTFILYSLNKLTTFEQNK